MADFFKKYEFSSIVFKKVLCYNNNNDMVGVHIRLSPFIVKGD